MALTMKQWRRLKGYSQREMAKRCGVFVNTYFNWEQSPEKLTVEKTHIIADALGVPYNDIIFSSDDTLSIISV